MATSVWGVMYHVRDASGHVHKLVQHDGRLVVACRAQLEEPVVRIPQVPEECCDEALCAECWPRRFTDIAAGES